MSPRRWSISAEACGTANGIVVRREGGGHSYTYAELAGDLAGANLNPEPRLRAKPQLIGQRIANVLTPEIVSGKLQFGLDVRVPDAVLVRPPNASSKLAASR